MAMPRPGTGGATQSGNRSDRVTRRLQRLLVGLLVTGLVLLGSASGRAAVVQGTARRRHPHLRL